ncbi:hypothetical protein [Miltoncostaea oceani]|uniref:hypothetical protein n=1 Tax=Miltoncostaea oceani TaxID=2843216 RepID=UPI001C3D06CD|nr:hypothetical protein [Miltoncostaea oceani]
MPGIPLSTTGTLSRALTERLGPALVGYIAAAGRPHVAAWNAESSRPDHEQIRRLQAASAVFGRIEAATSPEQARAFFIGRNDLLGDRTPSDALRAGDMSAVSAAADHFLT